MVRTHQEVRTLLENMARNSGGEICREVLVKTKTDRRETLCFQFENKTKKDKAAGAMGNPPKRASLFLHFAKALKQKVDYEFISENETTIEVEVRGTDA